MLAPSEQAAPGSCRTSVQGTKSIDRGLYGAEEPPPIWDWTRALMACRVGELGTTRRLPRRSGLSVPARHTTRDTVPRPYPARIEHRSWGVSASSLWTRTLSVRPLPSHRANVGLPRSGGTGVLHSASVTEVACLVAVRTLMALDVRVLGSTAPGNGEEESPPCRTSRSALLPDGEPFVSWAGVSRVPTREKERCLGGDGFPGQRQQ